MSDQAKGFAIAPKLDCPHLKQEQVKQLIQFLLQKNQQHFSNFQCKQCEDTSQNWICLQCQTIACSRYIKGHMSQHNSNTKHPITLSFSDASFWCYQCQSYIESGCLKNARIQLSKSKFAKDKSKLKEQCDQLSKQLEKLVIHEQIKQKQIKQVKFTYEQLINGLKSKQYKKIVFLTGAGLSVASGIPDFRSPKTGLYSQLQKYNLPYPEAVFEINFYKKSPQPFLRVAKQYLSGQYQPTLGHKFMKKIQDLDILQMILTQNIDDLQWKVGITQQKLLQAHGHGRSAHCIKCNQQASIQQWKQHLQKLQVMKCTKCQYLVKPDIVFFGQSLPKKFNQAPQIVQRADLVFVVGTSLAVMPFSFLATMIKKQCPVVLINNQDSMKHRNDKLWMKGDIQQNVQKIMKQLDWL